MLIYLVRIQKNGVTKYSYLPKWGDLGGGWGKPVAKYQTAKNQDESKATPGIPDGVSVLIEIVQNETTKLADTYYRDKYQPLSQFDFSYSAFKTRKILRIINAPR